MRQSRGRHRERQGDADMFVAAKRLAAELAAAVEHLPQQLAGMFTETLALRRELRRIDAAVDQVKSKPGFQRLDPSAERRLRRVSFLGGARKIAGLGHHQKILKPAKPHARKRSGSAARLANASFASPRPAIIRATISIIPRSVI